MPFEPQLIHPEDPPLTPDGELQLPGDLAALAEQLGDDSRHLAARYPAARPRGPLAPRAAMPQVTLAAGGANSHRWQKATILAGSSLATLLFCLVAIQQFASGVKPGPIEMAARATAPAGTAVATPRPAVAPAAVMAVPSISPTISLGDLSGPELEAVFDLWQRGQDDENQSIAF